MSYRSLYGVMIYVYPDGYIGQFISHEIYTKDGVRYWKIRYGYVTWYAYVDGYYIPFIVNGVPLPLVMRLVEKAEHIAKEEIPIGEIEVRESDIINLDGVLSGDAVMIIDKYGLLRVGSRALEYEELIRKYQSEINTLQKALFSFETKMNEFRVQYETCQNRVYSYRVLNEELMARLSTIFHDLLEERLNVQRLKMLVEELSTTKELNERSIQSMLNYVNQLEGYMNRILSTLELYTKRIEEKVAGAEERKAKKKSSEKEKEESESEESEE